MKLSVQHIPGSEQACKASWLRKIMSLISAESVTSETIDELSELKKRNRKQRLRVMSRNAAEDYSFMMVGVLERQLW
jgi:hypothetical protein